MVLTGDTSASILSAAIARYKGTDKALDGCELLKNPHHNGRLPSSVLKALKPKVVVVCNSSPPSSAYRKLIRSIGAALFTAAWKSKGGNGNVTLTVE
jgi:adenylate kinase